MTENTTKSVLTNTVEIDDPADPAIKYEFEVPGFAKQMQLGMYAKAIRRKYDPTGVGDAMGLDGETAMLAWSIAAFELLLKGAGVKWPYSEGENKQPVVDHTKWAEDKLDVVLDVGVRLDAELMRFRQERTSGWNPDRGKALAGSGNTGPS